MDAFASCYTTVNGSVTIIGAGIFNLASLSNLEEITGNLTIQPAGVFNLAGLDNLHTVGGNVTIFYNFILSSLDGLENLGSVGGNFWMYYNFLLSDCCAVMGLLNTWGVLGSTVVFFNKTGCNSVADINNSCGGYLVDNSGGTNTAHPAPIVPNKSKLSTNGLEIFPNPNAGKFNVRFPKANTFGELLLYNATGQVVWQAATTAGDGLVEIDVKAGIFPGIYLLRFVQGGQTFSKRVMIN